MNLNIIKNESEYHELISYVDSIYRKNLSKEKSDEISMIEVLVGDYEKRKQENNINPESIDHIYNLVNKISRLEDRSDLCKRGLKLNEEVGELSAEILKLDGYKYSSDSKDEIRKNLLLEASDSIIQIFDILVGLEYSRDEISQACEEKINKWLSQIKKNKNKNG